MRTRVLRGLARLDTIVAVVAGGVLVVVGVAVAVFAPPPTDRPAGLAFAGLGALVCWIGWAVRAP